MDRIFVEFRINGESMDSTLSPTISSAMSHAMSSSANSLGSSSVNPVATNAVSSPVLNSTLNTSKNPSEPVSVNAYVIGQTDALEAALIRDNVEIFTQSTDDGVVEFDFADAPSAGKHVYCLRVTQSNGECAWSSPVWVERNP